MKKLIIISLLAAMSYGSSCETSIKAMFNSGKLRTELEKVIVEKMGGEYVVKSLKAEFGEIK